jgi:hypothetical protein
MRVFGFGEAGEDWADAADSCEFKTEGTIKIHPAQIARMPETIGDPLEAGRAVAL